MEDVKPLGAKAHRCFAHLLRNTYGTLLCTEVGMGRLEGLRCTAVHSDPVGARATARGTGGGLSPRVLRARLQVDIGGGGDPRQANAKCKCGGTLCRQCSGKRGVDPPSSTA